MATDLVLPMGDTARRWKGRMKRETIMVFLLLLLVAAREASGVQGFWSDNTAPLREETGMTDDEMVGWHHPLNMSLSKFQETVKDREAWCASVHGVSKSWIQLSKCTTNWSLQVVGDGPAARQWSRQYGT